MRRRKSLTLNEKMILQDYYSGTFFSPTSHKQREKLISRSIDKSSLEYEFLSYDSIERLSTQTEENTGDQMSNELKLLIKQLHSENHSISES